MNKKATFDELVLIQIVCLIIIIAIIIYFIFFLIPNNDKCEKKCKEASKEKLVSYEVPIFSNDCRCYYSNSIKNFKLK